MSPFLRRGSRPATEPTPSLSEYLDELGREAAAERAGPLASLEAQGLREAAEQHYPSSAASSASFARAAAALELGAVYALGIGFALRVGELETRSPAPVPPHLSSRLRAAGDPAAEADAVSRELARPSPGAPRAEFLALFAAGQEVWAGLEEWVEATGRAASRRRLRERLDAAGVGPHFDIEPALERISYAVALRSGYALAACEQELSVGAAL